MGGGGLHFGTVNSASPPKQTKSAKRKKKKKVCRTYGQPKQRRKKAPRQGGFRLLAKLLGIHKKAIRRRKKYKALKSRFCSKKV